MRAPRAKAVAGLLPDVLQLVAPDLLARLVPRILRDAAQAVADALGPEATALLFATVSAAQWAHQAHEAVDLARTLSKDRA